MERAHMRADAERIAALADKAHNAKSDAEFRAALDRIGAINRELDRVVADKESE